MADTTRVNKVATRQLRGLMAFLAIEFILGIILTTLVNYEPYKHSGVQTGFLAAHIVIGIGLVIGAIARLVIAWRTKFLRVPSTVGFLGIAAAFGSGIAAASSGSDIAVFIMALCFLIAIMAYGISLSRTAARPA